MKQYDSMAHAKPFDVNISSGDAANPINGTLAVGDSYLADHTLSDGVMKATIRNTHGSLSLFTGASDVATSGAKKGMEIKPGFEDDFISIPGAIIYIKSTGACTYQIKEV